MLRKAILLLLLPLVFCYCGPKTSTLDPTQKSDSELYQLGVTYMEKGDYSKAREAYKVVFENFPKSDFRILAKLGLADAYFKEGGEPNYLLAIAEYQDFISLFPFSPKSEYAQLQVGMCYFKMVEKPDRDQTNTRKALDEFRKVVDNYPNGPHYQEAHEMLIKTYSLLAEHEYQVARYYERTGRPAAAVDRIKGLFKQYPESVHAAHHYLTIARNLERLEQTSESCTYYDRVLSQWPGTEEATEAQEGKNRVCSSAASASQ